MSAKRGCLSSRKHILSVRFDTRRKLLNANGNANGSLYGIRPNFLLQARWICAAQRHSVLLFPGQGAQYVGMCGRLLYNPRVAELFERAQRILGYDILQVCISGTANELNKTEFCQPAVMLSSLAALECLADTRPEVTITNCYNICQRPFKFAGSDWFLTVAEMPRLKNCWVCDISRGSGGMLS